MKKVAQAINSFPIEEPPSSNTAAVLVPLETLQAILQGLKSLHQEVRDLKKKVDILETREGLYHGPAPLEEEIPLLKEVWAKRREILGDLPGRVAGIEDDLSTLEKEVHSKEPKASGKKRDARTKMLKELLKGYGGSQTFKQLQGDMGLSPSQFSQLVDKLDKRVFEIAPRPRGKKGEKVLKLKARIREPLMIK